MNQERSFCCEDFEMAAFPGSSEPVADELEKITRSPDGQWSVLGCCGGGCEVLSGIRFCPFCGRKLDD